MASITPIYGSDVSGFDITIGSSPPDSNFTNIKGIAASADGTIMYFCTSNVFYHGVLKSTNSGATWSNVNNYPSTTAFSSIACSSDGSIVHAVILGDGLYTSINSGTFNKVTFATNTLPGGGANPESPTGGQFPGYDLTNIFQIACDSTGTKLIMTTNAAASIYYSTDSGVTWSFLYAPTGYSLTPNGPTTVAMNADGSVLYAALNTNTISKNIIVSKNAGARWASIPMFGQIGPFTTLSTNSYGDFVFAVNSNSDLRIFYPTHNDYASVVVYPGTTIGRIAAYNSGNNIAIVQNIYGSITNGAVVTYSIVNKYAPNERTPCFKEDSKILCFKDGKEVYVKVQEIRKGDLVKTVKHGYVPVNMIGTSKMYNSGDKLRGTNRLYVCSPDQYPGLTEDLVITGCHSILVDTLTEEQRFGTIELLGRIMITDNKYRLMAFLDERATPYLEEGVFPIWHIALDNDDYYMNYGIYANGLLVETCSKRYLKEISGMTLIE
uniref:Hedgehog/Intein (Hint) domain-containing protein n=1 Tax=viral metagenome TaxID=1070528 RepID=A0A6C0APB7_9ZZZZ